MKSLAALFAVTFASGAFAAEYHVAVTGTDAGDGTPARPFKTIAAAARLAAPGDTVTVHAGIYRERVDPPRGGESDARRIVYQAAPGESVTITGAELAKGWEKVSGDTWKLTLANSYFGAFNPFKERISGDWFSPQGRIHHRGCVYLGDDWLIEAGSLAEVLKPAGKQPLWFAMVDGSADKVPEYLLNVASFKAGAGPVTPADKLAAKRGTQLAACSEGGQCVGFIRVNDWLRYDGVDFGTGTETIEIRAAANVDTGGVIELRLDRLDGELLGTCTVGVTGNWQRWHSFTAKIKPTRGVRSLYMVFKPGPVPKTGTDLTVILAQFPGVDPNATPVEINVRPTVFSPSKTGINYLTVRGFKLCRAATNWAPPTSGQVGLLTAYWCKGWIIEHNEVSHSRCSGIALGKYSDQWDNFRGTTEGYYLTIDDAIKKDGWTKENIGGHRVRDNHIHHCEQTGIVGSLGCAFSRIDNNSIHDIHVQGLFGGAEMAGIKFHGALDVVISGNHIYRCGQAGGVWLDWMAQGTQVTGNLFHDNAGHDLFCEVDHGPYLVANNLMLSPVSHLANSRGGAYAHNLVVGKLDIVPDSRRTPFFKAHCTDLVAMHDCPVGDARWLNNLLVGRANLNAYNGATLPVTMSGNVFTHGALPSKFEPDALLKPDFDPGVKLTEKADGWYLAIAADPAWATDPIRKLVTTALLGKAAIPDLPFENPDGSPLKIDTDYFGHPRNAGNLFPGPFDGAKEGSQEFKVWPRDPKPQ